MKIKELLKIISAPVTFASLCCLTPLVLVALGISTVSFGSSLADSWYGDYKWLFRAIGVLSLVFALSLGAVKLSFSELSLYHPIKYLTIRNRALVRL